MEVKRIKSKLFLILSVIFILLFISSVSAIDNNDVDVQNFNNIDENYIISDDDTVQIYVNNNEYSNLQDALNNASENDTIYLSQGTYKGEGNVNLDVDIFNLTIIPLNDEKVIFDGENTNHIFNVISDYVTIKNIEFINALSDNKTDGAAISWLGDYGNLIDSTFMNNTAGDKGGAIYWNGKNSTIKNSVFKSNNANSGAAIYYGGGNATIMSSTFSDNNASDESTIWFNSDDCRLINSIVTNNTSNGRGAVVLWGERGFVDNSKFINNHGEIGASLFFRGGNGILNNSVFSLNNIAGSGASVYWDSYNGTISNCNFTDNKAGSGSALFITAQYVKLLNSNFINNTADVGNVHWSGQYGYAYNLVFNDNYANLFGGAIFGGSLNAIIKNTTFKNNTAVHAGGAIYWNGENLSITNSSFIENHALGNEGGAIHLEGLNDTVSNSEFYNNAARVGGAINSKGVNSQLNNNVYYNNSARDEAGAIRVDSVGSVNINNSILENNNAPTGSAIYNLGNLTVNNSVILKNKANSKSLNITCDVNKTDATINITFEGWDNLLNSIYNTANVSFNNVTYLGVNGIMNTNNNSQVSIRAKSLVIANGILGANEENFIESTCEAHQNLTVIIYDKNNNVIKNITDFTDLKGNIVLSLSNLSPGNYTVYAEHINDEYYTYINNTSTFEIEKFNSTIVLDAEDVYFHDNVTVIATVSDGATGNVIFTFNGRDIEVPIINFTAKLIIPNLVVDDYNISAIYEGDDNFTASENETTFKVMKINSTIIIKCENITYGEDEIIIANIPYDATGEINFIVNGQSYIVNATNASANITIRGLNASTYNVTAFYSGDNNYYPSENITEFNVAKIKTNLSVVAKDIMVGDVESIVITGLPSQIKGNITVNVNGTNYTVEVQNGSATLNISDLLSGNYSVLAIYPGNINYESSNATTIFNVSKYPVNMNLTTKDIMVGDDEIIVVSSLPSDYTGNITVIVNGNNYTVDVNNGVATLNISNLKEGNYNVVAIYSENDKYLGDEVSSVFIVSKYTPNIDISSPDIRVGENGNVKVTLSSDATGNVTIFINGKNYTAILVNGSATFNIPDLDVGKYDIMAIYPGDDKYNPVNGTSVLNVFDIPEFNETLNSNEKIGMDNHQTANPLAIFALALIILIFTPLRCRK